MAVRGLSSAFDWPAEERHVVDSAQQMAVCRRVIIQQVVCHLNVRVRLTIPYSLHVWTLCPHRLACTLSHHLTCQILRIIHISYSYRHSIGY